MNNDKAGYLAKLIIWMVSHGKVLWYTQGKLGCSNLAVLYTPTFNMTWSSSWSVGIALGYGLDDRGPRVRFPAGAGNFSLHHCVQTDSGA
jgi:hypothetical protein